MLVARQMNRTLPEAVLATFLEDDREAHEARLDRFTGRDWRRATHWLDTSGLALYFLNRVTTLGLEHHIPVDVFGQLHQRLMDNRLRTRDLVDEFVNINQRFDKAGIRYVNLKGFALIPDYCPDPSLRYQLDLDFLMCPSEIATCCDVLRSLGYVGIRPADHVMEFRAGMERVPSVRDLYKPKSRRSVEVHFAISLPEEASALLGRSRRHTINGFEFPVLSRADMFLAQTLHLFKHFRAEWTRISWLLEFKTFVVAQGHNSPFWHDVRILAEKIPQSILGLGTVVHLGTEIFGEFAPADLTAWSVDALPKLVRLWLERYGRTALLSDFPGTKLYLLLERELAGDRTSRTTITRERLFPLHRPPTVAYVRKKGIGSQVQAQFDQIRFVLFRLKFHIVEGLRYLIEVHRWRHIVNGSLG